MRVAGSNPAAPTNNRTIVRITDTSDSKNRRREVAVVWLLVDSPRTRGSNVNGVFHKDYYLICRWLPRQLAESRLDSLDLLA